jgi:DNA-binding HxlR family transcriptional regulator
VVILFFQMKSLSEYEQKIDKLHDGCPIKAAIDVIRGRWKPMILWELNGGPKRFSDLQAAQPEIAPQVLTVQLRQLEADGIITRTVHPEIPARVEYALTELGRALSAVMDQLELWGTRYLEHRTQQLASAR